MKKYIGIVSLLAIAPVMAQKLIYPTAPKDDTVDEYFGMKVADPFRPLEDDTAAVTTAWVQAENAVTRGYLDQIPFRDAINKRLTALNNYHKSGTPSKHKNGKYYFYENNGLQNQSVLFELESLDGTPRVFLDPNTLSEDGTVALTGVYFSKDEKYAAYTISRSGSDWTEIYVMDANTLEPLPDHIEWAKFTGASWRGDGFYYSAYGKPEAGKEFSNANENHRIYYHKLGTPQEEDVLVFEDPENPLHFHSPGVSDDERFLFLYTSGQGMGNAVAVMDLQAENPHWVTIEGTQEKDVNVIDVIDGNLLILTTWDAPMGRVVTVPISNPSRENWVDFIPEQKGVMSSIQRAGSDLLIVGVEKDASDHFYLYDLQGNLVREIALPTLGSAGFTSSKHHDEVFYGFTSFVYPNASFSYDLKTGESKLIKSAKIEGFNPDDYVTEQVWYKSSDGTPIPMFLTYKKGLERNGKNPVYLYGYGGFNVNLNPGFSANRLFWLENGGIYAQATLRGGGEYGETWHEAGTKMNKLNVFNDFISAAEYMINQGWTSPEHLVIEGGSNGGLLVGATVNMRPDLFKVAIPRVGVMDMMRYHLFTIGWNWASDYGTSADSPEMAAYLLGYSPLHNIKNDGTPYPAILVTTADHDDRVVPAHSFKYAATLQEANTGDAPKIIRIDSKAGHGAGKPISKTIDEWTDIYSFTFQNLGIQPTK
ncbi:MAG: prolyl oligopeptidase family serine peptidase [Bacteroidales bacterium]|nr:prolyl oligopeptidase family serine peptidase [Bacteroidales bacterium]